MHFEILVEDQSGKKMLDVLVPRIIGAQHTCKIIPFKGLGRVPPRMSIKEQDPRNRHLLNILPQFLRAYGKSLADYPAAVIVVCDLDNRCLKAFRQELFDVLSSCDPQPETRFCIAVEEGEAWLLGDLEAVQTAYPQSKNAVLRKYNNDSICGTWELLADAVSQGGARELSKMGWQTVGAEKSQWAERIAPHIDVERNASPSFQYFRNKIRELAEMK